MALPSRTRFISATSLLALTAALAACGTPQPPAEQVVTYPSSPVAYPNQPANYVEYGRVSNIEVIRTEEKGKGSGAGAVIGGIAGAVIGHQIGGGTGRDLATAAGAIGGAVVGNNVEKRNKTETHETWRVSIQVDRGGYRAYDVDSAANLRVGDRVRIENGQIYRL
ncbi:MAG: glycine zipper 2TM domain-containing protein [Ramlibacter sp.]|nr:glycine zipper 2TM domain-containing protein [Ramlibacter sp.]